MLMFQDIDKMPQNMEATRYFDVEPAIRPGDNLLITVSSPVLTQEKIAQYNLPLTSYLVPGETAVLTTASLQTYLVDKNGFITFPVVGDINLGGLTKTKATEKIKEAIQQRNPEFDNLVVNLQFIDFKVYVTGEVTKPGPVPVTSTKISILDAIGEAGGLTTYGNRTDVLLIRNVNDKIEHIRFDLTKSDIFTSPYFYLQQNDIVIVEPNDTRLKDSKVSAADSFRMSVMSFGFSVISVIVSTIITLRAIN
jgi:polysaccharide export outer membrane protein